MGKARAGMAEDSANRTHQRLQQPPNGFEDRPEHQSRLPSVSHCSGKGRRARRTGTSIFSLKREVGGGGRCGPPRGSPFLLDFDLRGRPAGGGFAPPDCNCFPPWYLVVFRTGSSVIGSSTTNGKRSAAPD